MTGRRPLPDVPRRWWRALAVALVLHLLVAAVLVAVVSSDVRGPQRPHYVEATLLPPPTPAPSPHPIEPHPVAEPDAGLPVDSKRATPASVMQSPPAVFAEVAAADAALNSSVQVPQPEPAPVTSSQADQAMYVDTADAVAHDTDAQRQWESQVLTHLEQHKRYPPRAQQWHQQDRVLLGIRVGRDGQVQSQWIVDSAGFPLLDREAIDLAQRASPLPMPPDTLADHELDFVVAIEFQIDRRADAFW